MQSSIYTTIETLVPRAEVGGLENCNDYLQVFGDKGKARKVGAKVTCDVELDHCVIKGVIVFVANNCIR